MRAWKLVLTTMQVAPKTTQLKYQEYITSLYKISSYADLHLWMSFEVQTVSCNVDGQTSQSLHQLPWIAIFRHKDSHMHREEQQTMEKLLYLLRTMMSM